MDISLDELLRARTALGVARTRAAPGGATRERSRLRKKLLRAEADPGVAPRVAVAKRDCFMKKLLNEGRLLRKAAYGGSCSGRISFRQ